MRHPRSAASSAPLAIMLSMLFAATANAQFIGPTPYLCEGDSPWPITSPGYFLETFEDGSLNTLGVTGDGGLAGPGGIVDSVDCDDGVINGFGEGRSYFGSGSVGLTFTFNPAAFGGRFPQRVGIVWTDGVHTNTPDAVHFEAFDHSGQRLGEITGTHADNSVDSETAEDRFYGIQHASGISRIRIYQTAGCCGIEVDHLQYGFTGCPADFNQDGFVDDTDFVLFTQQYAVFDCADPAMPDGCSADLNADGFVDDTDFVFFSQAYEQFTCE